VLSEATWTLARSWKRTRAEVAEFIERILETEAFVVVFRDAARRALQSYRNSAADYADLPDCRDQSRTRRVHDLHV